MRQLARQILYSGYPLIVGGMVVRALAQAVLVLLLARLLSRDAFGVNVAIISVTGFFATLVGMGASVLHLRDIAISPQDWPASLSAHHRNIWRSQLPLFILSWIVAWLIAGQNIDPFPLACLVAGDLIGFPTVDLMIRSYQGRGEYLSMAVAMVSLPGLRMVAALGVYLAFGVLDLSSWCYISSSTGLLLALVVVCYVRRVTKLGSSSSRKDRGIMAGVGFAMASASTKVHADSDKAIVARLDSFGSAGDYSIAYRLMDVLLLPISAALEWAMRNLFQIGLLGFSRKLALLWRQWLVLLLLSLLLCAVAYGVASFLPVLFGSQYIRSVEMAHWLAFIPLSAFIWMTIRSLAATGGHEKAVGVVELIGACLSVIVGALLVMLFGWRGAVIATYAVHFFMTLAIFIVLIRWRPLRSCEEAV